MQVAVDLELPHITTEVSTVLPVAAPVAFEIFADVVETPRWLSVVQSAHVIDRGDDTRPRRVAFLTRLRRGTLGYALDYEYDLDRLAIRWTPPEESATQITGEAQFVELQAQTCLLNYRISIELPFPAAWADPSYDGHAASAVVSQFREYLRRFA